MFWKFVVSVLLLPSCLGFEITAASRPKSKELGSPVQQTQANQNALNSLPQDVREYLSIQGQEANTAELKHTKRQQDRTHRGQSRRRSYR